MVLCSNNLPLSLSYYFYLKSLLFFRVSQELAKATNDWVWCGAAIEGLASAKVLELPVGHSAAGGDAGVGGLQHRRGRSNSISGVAPLGGTSVGVSGWPTWELLRSRGVEADVKDLMAEARVCYKKKGGVLAMQVV